METAEQDAIDARRWRAVKQRHAVAMTRLATGSTSYSSMKAPAILDAWADMAAAEIDAFDPGAYRAEVDARIAEFEKHHGDGPNAADKPTGAACRDRSA